MFIACSFGIDERVGDSGSAPGVVGSLKVVCSYGSTSLGVTEGDSHGEVALLPRDCGRDDSKELDEELLLSDGVRRFKRGPGLGEAAGSIMIGFAF